MIGVVATIWVQPEKAEDFERLTRGLEADVTAHEPGCKLYRMMRSRDEPNTYSNIELFDDQVAMDAHMAADYFKVAVEGIGQCLARAPDVRFFETLT